MVLTEGQRKNRFPITGSFKSLILQAFFYKHMILYTLQSNLHTEQHRAGPWISAK